MLTFYSCYRELRGLDNRARFRTECLYRKLQRPKFRHFFNEPRDP